MWQVKGSQEATDDRHLIRGRESASAASQGSRVSASNARRARCRVRRPGLLRPSLAPDQFGIQHRLAGGNCVGRGADPPAAAGFRGSGFGGRGHIIVAAASSCGDMWAKRSLHTTDSLSPNVSQPYCRRCAADRWLSLCLKQLRSCDRPSPAPSAGTR
jgi:hypothetical protein